VLTVTPLDVTNPEDLRDAYAVIDDVTAHDTPDDPRDDFATFATGVATDWEGQQRVRYLARLDDEPAGFASLALLSGDNRDLAQVVKLMTRPVVRRRGVGRGLFTALHRHATADGRVAIIGGAKVGVPGGSPVPAGGEEFALAMGGVEAARSTYSRLELTDPAMPARLAATLDTAQARSGGYSVVVWRDRAPDEYVADVAALYSRVLTEQPTGSIGWVDENYDVERFRELEQSLIDHGFRSYCAAARHDATGRTVGYTEIAVPGALAWQGNTIVEPAHRGHRLGLLIKATNLLRTGQAEPDARYIETRNDEDNPHILDINRTIGFHPHSTEIDYRFELRSR
jgi:GNAT superfamily N-acetyltransferase